MKTKKYYAIVGLDGSGPAYGIGTTETEAWQDAALWGVDNSTGKAVQITARSFHSIQNGNPDGIEII